MENKILATVNGIAITEDEVNEIIAGLGPRGQAYNNPEGRQAVLGQLIASKLLLIEARANLYETEPAFKAELARVRENLLISYATDKAVSGVSVSDAEVEEYYNANKQRFVGEESVNASHILVSDEATALALFSGEGDDANMPHTEIAADMIVDGKVGIIDLMIAGNLAKSKGEARRLIEQGGISVDGEKVTDFAYAVSADALKDSVKVKKGKKIFHKFSLQ